MIKGNELRIGNIINYKGNPIIISMIVLYGIHGEHETGKIAAKFYTPDLTPIPLSEEILLKCGFEINKDYVSEDHLWHDLVKEGVRIQLPYFEFKHEDGDYSVEIKHLHQLQNLYFALTGQDLNTSGL